LGVAARSSAEADRDWAAAATARFWAAESRDWGAAARARDLAGVLYLIGRERKEIEWWVEFD
jgi:hypothetical protein